MILRRQADPGRELPPRSKHLRRRGLHHQQRRADRTDAGNLGETSAAFIGLVPGHELGVDFGDLRLQLRIFFSLSREQLASQDGHVLISLNAIEQRIDVRPPPGGGKAELGRIAADGVRQLRAIADQPIAQGNHHQSRLLFGSLHRHEAHRRPGKGAGFRSLRDTWADTTTAHGRLMLIVLGGLAEFERELIRARTGEGRERAKARGVKMGRRPKLADHQKREAIKRRDHGEETLAEIGQSYNVSGWTISRLVPYC